MTQSGSLPVRPRLRRMLEGRTVAVVGASERADSFGWRMATEVLRSPGIERSFLVHPRRDTVLGQPCLPSLADVPEPVDLVLLGVPDHALLDQVRLAAARGRRRCRRLRRRRRASARSWWLPPQGLEICGGGCMGFVNAVRGVRAIGYLERDPLPPGPIALVTHSGSVFSAMLRTHRRLEYSVAVSSGQELVTTAADHLTYALSLPETKVVGLVLETLRDADTHAGGARRRGVAGHPRRRADRRHLVARADAGRRALGCDRRLGRRLGGAVLGVRRAPGRRPRRAGRQPGVVRDRPPGPRGRAGGDRHRARLGGRAGAGRRRGRAPRRPVRAAVRARRPNGWPDCSTRDSSRPTRSTSGAPAPTPRTCCRSA